MVSSSPQTESTPHPAPPPAVSAVGPKAPVVSVLMPVRNAEPYLGEAVESILSQRFGDFEFLVIDDGSTDGSREILRVYERLDERMRVYERPQLGYVRQLNFGLEMCRGEFIARMDADDIATPDRLDVQLAEMRKQPEVLVLGGAYDLVDAAGRMLHRHWPATDDASLQAMCLDGRTPIGHPTAMMRRQAVLDAGGYDVTLETAEDNDLWLRLGERGKLACVPHVVLKYRQHDRSVSERRAEEQADRLRVGCERAYRRRGLNRQFDPPPAWRPTGEGSRFQFLLQYGWWAYNSAQRRTAILYGLKAIQKRPLSTEPWSLLYASMLKILPQPEPPPYPTPYSTSFRADAA